MSNQLKLWLALTLSLSIYGCNDTDGIFGNVGDSASVGVKSELNIGPFDGCVSATALDTSQIYVTFSFPSGVEKMNVYRNGQVAYTSTAADDISFIDVGLVEGATYSYTCEALGGGKFKLGSKRLSVSTLITHAPQFAGVTHVTVVPTPDNVAYPNSAFVQWAPASANGTAAATSYKVYAVPGSVFNWANYPTVASLPSPRKVVSASSGKLSVALDDLGDQIPYTIFVRACAASDLCDSNQVTMVVNLPDDGAFPKTVGAVGVSIDRVLNVITLDVPWADTDGAVAKRYIYYKQAPAGQLTPVPASASEMTQLRIEASPDGAVPSTQIRIAGLPDNRVYHFLVQDQEPGPANDGTGKKSANTKVVSIDAGDMTRPNFPGGIMALDYGDLNQQNLETTLTASWTAVAPQPGDPAGPSTFVMYLSDATKDACLDGVAQSNEVNAALDSNGAAVNPGVSVLKGVISGLKSRTTYRVCVKAKDAAGNISLTSNYLEATTRDVSAPIFDGIQTFDPLTMDIVWNPSVSSDVSNYRVKIFRQIASAGAEFLAGTLTKSKVGFPSGFTLTTADVTYAEGDTLRVLVDACDDAAPSFNSGNNCTDLGDTHSISRLIPDKTPPQNFPGISPAGDLTCGANEGEVVIKWGAPTNNDWSDYVGFNIYTVDASNNLQPLRMGIECQDRDCVHNPVLQKTVTGLTPYRTYKFYVNAYDAIGNVVTKAMLPVAANSVSFRACDFSAPGFSSNISVSKINGGLHLAWGQVTSENQYPLEGSVSYSLYRSKAPFNAALFAGEKCISIPSKSTQLPASCLSSIQSSSEFQLLSTGPLKAGLSYDDLKSNVANGVVEGFTYYYLACAADSSGNTVCDGSKIATKYVDDMTPPILNLDKSPATKPLAQKTWDIHWTMADVANVTPVGALQVIIKKKPTVCGATVDWNGEPKYVDKTGQQILDLNGNNLMLSAESAPADTEGCMQYQFTIKDAAGNYVLDTLAVPFDNLGPSAATALSWADILPNGAIGKVALKAQWTPSTNTTDLSGQKINIYSNRNCTGSPVKTDAFAKTVTSYSYTAADHADYSFNIESDDNISNYSLTPCVTTPATVDTTPFAMLAAIDLSPNRVAANNVAFSTLSIAIKNQGNAVIPGKTLSVKTDQSDSGQPRFGHDTVTALNAVTDATGVAKFKVRSNMGGDTSILAHLVEDNMDLTATPISFVSYADVSKCVVSVDKSLVVADGSELATVTITLKDMNSTVLQNKKVLLASTNSVGQITGLNPNGSGDIVSSAIGQVQFTIKASVVDTSYLKATVVEDAVDINVPAVQFVPGPVAKVAFIKQPSNAVAGVAIKAADATAFQVAIYDKDDHLATNRDATIKLTIDTNAGVGAPGVIASGTDSATTTTGTGKASFTTASINKKGQGYTLKATVLGSSPTISAVSSSFNIVAGAPSKLVWIQEPTDSSTCSPFSMPVQVGVSDAGDNIIDDLVQTINVTLTLSANPGSAILMGTTTTQASGAGVAAFGSLNLTKIGTGYRILASADGGVLPVQSVLFNVALSAPQKFVVQLLNGNSDYKVGVNKCSHLRVFAYDSCGANISAVTADTSVSISHVSAHLAGALFSSTDTTCVTAKQSLSQVISTGSTYSDFYYSNSMKDTDAITAHSAQLPVDGTLALDVEGKVKFTYTGADQLWTVPAGVTSIKVKAWGAGGGGVYGDGGSGGAGGAVIDDIAVSPNEVVTVIVGAAGKCQDLYYGGDGGGRSAIRITRGTVQELITAGGGGGGSYTGDAGAGGYPSGISGRVGQTSGNSSPGDNTRPGTSGSGVQWVGSTASGVSSVKMYGGGAIGESGSRSSGGGGGYWGGAGGASPYWCWGACPGGGGGGGSSYSSGGAVSFPSNGTQANGFYNGSARVPGNTLDPDYVSGVGVGGLYSIIPANNTGGPGLIVISW